MRSPVIESHDSLSDQRIVVRDFERALAAAARLDRALARGSAGHFSGFPMTVKESFNVAALPTERWALPMGRTLAATEDAGRPPA